MSQNQDFLFVASNHSLIFYFISYISLPVLHTFSSLCILYIALSLFPDKLSYLITDQELDLRRLNNGVRPRRLRTRARRELDSKIINAQEDLVNQR